MPDMSLESVMHDDTQQRIAALEKSVASVSATVEGLVNEWRHERDDLKNSIGAINNKLDSAKTTWKDFFPVLTGIFVVATLLFTVGNHEIQRVYQEQERIRMKLTDVDYREMNDAGRIKVIETRLDYVEAKQDSGKE